MPYKVEIYDYKDNAEELEKVSKFLFDIKKMIVIEDLENDDCIIIVSTELERDKEQARIICDALNKRV